MPNPETRTHLISIAMKRLPHGVDIDLPSYATIGAAGMDVRAALESDFTLAPGERHAIPCGFAMAVPLGLEAQIRPRSGLALKHGITIANTPGTIDSDYRGEISVVLINLGRENFIITRGMRIAQMVIAEVTRCCPLEVNDLDHTVRGADGFGSTGI
jgi:dUTP pyrophosphatase